MNKKYIASMIFASILLVSIASTQALSSLDNFKGKDIFRLENALEHRDLDRIPFELLEEKDLRKFDLILEKIEDRRIRLENIDPDQLKEFRTRQIQILEEFKDAVVIPNIEEIRTELEDVKGRFIMYTHDGMHILWGNIGNGHFVGQDDTGAEIWGIYENHKFAGFKDGELFYGSYRGGHKGGFWKAFNLYDEESFGRFVLFPQRQFPEIFPQLE